MRITQKMNFNTITQNMLTNQNQLLKIQEQLSSGKKFSSPSDDPIAASKSLTFYTSLDQLDQYKSNLIQARSMLNITESALDDAESAISRAQELAVAMSNGTINAEAREGAAEEIEQILSRLISLGNTKLGDRYIFAGFNSATQPFIAATGALSASLSAGDTTGSFQVEIEQDQKLAMTLSGEEVFQGYGLSGGVNVFTIVTDLQTALESNDVATVTAQIDNLDTAANQVSQERAKVGARTNRLDTTEASLDNTKLILNTLLSETEGSDIVEAASAMAYQQTIYEASLATAANMMSFSLLNFLG